MYAVVVAAFSLISYICAQDQVRMTMISSNHFKSEVDGWYQCHLSNPDKTGTNVTSFRTVNTRNNGISKNPHPPDPVPVLDGSSNLSHYQVFLDDNDSNSWFGVFGCGATRSDKKETRISTTRMRSDADFLPVNELFTQTVNVGDRDVTITMMTRNGKPIQNMRWRKDSSGLKHNGKDTFLIDGPIQPSDAGTYECHERGMRDNAKQGLNLLLVRACSAYRWGPPDCNGVCDSCYNGGICDENNGKCVCPPGFMGDSCLEACGGNTYGHTCEIKCSSGGSDASCEGYLFCLIHPYGCRCNTGWKGLSCDTECDDNTFGASCLQACRCASNQCDRYTGICTGSPTVCKSGWTGDNCQECNGTNCNQECHCSKETCNKDSGLCKTGGCLPQWVDLYPPYSCQTGLINITYTKMNPGIIVPVTCEAVEGPQGDLGSLQLVLSRDSESLEDGNITAGERSQDGTSRNFTVANVQQGDMLHCQLRDGNDKLAVLNLSVEVFALPVLTSAPVSNYVDVTSVTISWSAWDGTKDVGDPPLVGYIPYYKKEEENAWIKCDMVPLHNLMYTYNSLNADTYYSFSVSAVREGEGGEGQRSPELSVTTTCDIPPNPEDVTAEISGERQELVKVSWELPPEEITCSSDITKFTIYYSESSETDATSVDVTDTEVTSFILSDLTPGVTYTLYVTLSTSGGESEISNKVYHLVPVLPTLTHPHLLTNATCNSVTMVWDKWTEETDSGTPPIIHYMPYHRRRASSDWTSHNVVPHRADKEKYEFIFDSLSDDSSYEFCVVTVREGYGGEGDKNNVVQEKTDTCKEGIEAYIVAVSVIVPVAMVFIILAVVFIYLRYRRNLSGQTPPAKPTEAKYENRAFTATDDYSTINKDHVESQSSMYEGLETKESTKRVVEVHPAKTGDDEYEVPLPSSSRGILQFSNVTKGNAHNLYEDPDISTDNSNVYVNIKEECK